MHPRIASLGRFLLLPAGTHHRDVWSLDLGSENATWIQLATDNPATVAPTPRRSATGVYDRTGDRLLVAFGRHGTTFTDEVWSFNLRNNTCTRLSS
jgi:hypothetical protein